MRRLLPQLRLSISTRLALWYGLSLLLLLSVFIVFLYASFHLSLHRDFEEQLRRDESALRRAVETSAAGQPVLQAEAARRAVALETRGAAGTYVRLFTPTGELLYRSPNFEEQAPLPPSLPSETRPAVTTRTWQGTPARSRYAPIATSTGELDGWLEVTRLESSLHRDLHQLRWLLKLGVLLGTVIAIASGYALARRALQPVATITSAARDIQAEDLSQRVPTDFGVRDELTDLAETLNALLARLDATFERERRFRADAAHEMFTPLSAIQSELDVALRRPREAGYYEEMTQTLRKHTARLSELVEDLLTLSRAEAAVRIGSVQADVSEVAARLVERFRVPAKTEGLEIRCHAEPGAVAAAEPAHLETILENLLDNAIKYTPPGGTVTVSARCDDEAVLRVADTGAGFTDEEADRLFDRFYRADTRLVQQQRGTGLGLSIAQAIAGVYGGRIEASSPGPGRGSTFAVRLPVAESQDDHQLHSA